MDNNWVSFLSGVERTQHGPEFQSVFLYVSVVITFFILVLTYIGIHLVLRLRHSKSIKIAERTRPVLKDNMVSLKTMIILVTSEQNRNQNKLNHFLLDDDNQ